MPKHEIEYRCGHTVTQTLAGTLERQAARMERLRRENCPACSRKAEAALERLKRPEAVGWTDPQGKSRPGQALLYQVRYTHPTDGPTVASLVYTPDTKFTPERYTVELWSSGKVTESSGSWSDGFFAVQALCDKYEGQVSDTCRYYGGGV